MRLLRTGIAFLASALLAGAANAATITVQLFDSTVLYQDNRLLIGVPHHDGAFTNQGRLYFEDNVPR